MTKFIATYIDTLSDGADFTPHVMGIYDSEDEAREEIFDDMDEFWISLEEDEQDEMTCDHEKLQITDGNGFICWNVEEIEI